MLFVKGTFTSISYKETGSFTPLIVDYLDDVPALRSFYEHRPDAAGLSAAIKAREAAPVNRTVLVEELRKQYKAVAPAPAVNAHIESLLDANTFTVCTAHQPALFTGTLYFVYKILHAIRLAAHLTQEHPGKKFVPVYWMGSEDADLDELGKFYLSGEKIVWPTKQTGAVGRMNTKGIDLLINRISGELSVQPFGQELVSLLKKAYTSTATIQEATFTLLHDLFSEFGLIVLIPDTAPLKAQMTPVFEADLFEHTPSAVTIPVAQSLEKLYKAQAHPRPVNLFYLDGSIRNRMERTATGFQVVDTDLHFTDVEIRNLLQSHPELFSPNVILRGLYQETVLPNVAFIGGGGETAYWLELKALFHHFKVPFPALVLRNSFLWVEAKWASLAAKTGFTIDDFFQQEQELLNRLARKNRNGELKLDQELAAAGALYQQLLQKAGAIDQTLTKHVDALKARSLKPIQELEKKMLRAEKRKYEAELRQIQAVRKALFPGNGLQERIDNFMPYYAKWGRDFIHTLYQHSFALEQQFGIFTEEA